MKTVKDIQRNVMPNVDKIEETYSDWLYFQKYQSRYADGKTKKTYQVTVKNAKYGAVIGEIKWYNGFRKYAFFSNSNIVFDNKCLNDISQYLDIINNEHKGVVK